MSNQVIVNSAGMILLPSHSKEIDNGRIYHNLVNPLRRDRNLDSSLRNFLTRTIDSRLFPNKKRVTIKIHPWSDTPILLKIDSHAKHCISCGNHAYYVSYFVLTKSCKLAWRLCWKCLNDTDREAIIDKYTIVN